MQEQRGNAGVDDFAVVDEEAWAGNPALDHHCTEQHRRRGAARNAEHQHGGQGAAFGSVVGAFGSDDPLRNAGAEFVVLARPLLRLVVAQEAGHRGTCRRHDTDEYADGRAEEDLNGAGDDQPQGFQDTPGVEGGFLGVDDEALGGEIEEFRHGEEADQCGNQRNAVEQVIGIQGAAHCAGRAHADGSQENAD